MKRKPHAGIVITMLSVIILASCKSSSSTTKTTKDTEKAEVKTEKTVTTMEQQPSVVTVEVTATADGFSDGELNYELIANSFAEVAVVGTAHSPKIANIPDQIVSNGSTLRCVHIDDEAFYKCANLTTLSVSKSINSIGEWTFANCDNLKNVDIQEGVSSIGTCAFKNCISLCSLLLPNSLTTLGTSVFEGCTGMKDIVIPDRVTRVELGAFYRCTSLESVTIGSGVAVIGALAFYDCKNLSAIHCKSSVPPTISNNVFSNYSAVLYVPQGSLQSYQSDAFWGRFSQMVEE